MQQSSFLCAFAVSCNGNAAPLGDVVASDAALAGGYIWMHLDARQPGARDWLQNQEHLPPSVVTPMLAEDTRPRAIIKDTGLLVIFRGMNPSEGESPEEMVSLRMWIDDRRVITTRIRDIKAIEEIQQSMKNGSGPVSPDEFLLTVASSLFAQMEPFIEDLEDRIAESEERVARGQESKAFDWMGTIRKRVAIFRRYVTPQRTVLQKLHESSTPFLRQEVQLHLEEELDRVTRYVEELEELVTRTQILNEEMRNAHAEKLNDIAFVFSVVATIFLPLGFLTGLLGVNVGGMPAMDNPYGFWIVTLMCVMLAGAMLLVFKRLKWF